MPFLGVVCPVDVWGVIKGSKGELLAPSKNITLRFNEVMVVAACFVPFLSYFLKMNREDYINKFEPDDAVGWDCIDARLKDVYPDTEAKHWCASPHYALGGKDPLDGVSIYTTKGANKHHHFISYGMSSLYFDPDNCMEDFSKWGFEFTFRLKPLPEENENTMWVISLMNNLARYVFKSKKWFESGHFIPAGGPIRIGFKTSLTGLIFITDPILGTISTPNGKVTFLQIVGITDGELKGLQANPSVEKVKSLSENLKLDNPLLMTDLLRT